MPEIFYQIRMAKTRKSRGKKDVFISYAHGQNNKYVPRTLAFYHRLVSNGANPWIDYYEMKDNRRSTMKAGIKRSRAFLALVNDDYRKSPNCNYEYDIAMQMKKPIFIVRV